jgi:hypothetical protein
VKRIVLFLAIWALAFGTSLSADTIFFKTNFERKQFKLAQKNSADIIDLFMSFDSDSIVAVSAKKKLNLFFQKVGSKGLEKKSSKAFAKAIFQEAHEFFLRQYEEVVPFSRIFNDGLYNCVSATALFGIILDHYNIPYVIKEAPTHVFLVAYPDNLNILFETTNPKGYFAPNDQLKAEYVKWLIKSKLTTQEYVNRIGIPKAFQEFYYSKEDILLINLAGIQYYNNSIELATEKKYADAIHQIVKATLLHPSKRNEFFQRSLIAHQLNNSKYENVNDIYYLILFANSTQDVSEKSEVIDLFKKIIYEQLFRKSNDSILNSTFNKLQSGIKDSLLAKDLKLQYFSAFADWYASKGRLTSAIEFSRNALKLAPKDATVQEILWRSIVMKYSASFGNNNDHNVLADYEKEFPFLKSNSHFKSLLIYNYAFASYKYFLDNKGDEGYRLMRQMELELKNKDKDVTVNDSQIALVFAEAGAFHFRKHEYKKAKEIILKGFEYTPNDGELKERLKIIEDEVDK